LYIYVGIAFLLWENLISSVVGIYAFELRRTLWGVLYYSLLFLLFGGVAELLTLVHLRWIARGRWSGQRYVWLLVIVTLFLWGDLTRELSIVIFGIDSIRLSYLVNLLWIPLFYLLGLILNRQLAKLEGEGRLPDSRQLLVYFFGFLLYLILSTKVTYRYFDYNLFSPTNFLLQPVFLSGALLLTEFSSRVFARDRSLQLGAIWLPVILTLLVLGWTHGVEPSYGNSVHPQRSTSDSPDVILIVFDALRTDYVGERADGSSLTPVIDSLARSGKSYSACYSTSSWTVPSVASLMTSQLPHSIDVGDLWQISRDAPTVAGTLRENGYYTAGFSANEFISPVYRFNGSFDRFEFTAGRGAKQLMLPYRTFFPCPWIMNELAYQFGFISNDIIVAEWPAVNKKAAEVLKSNSSKPIFLYLHYMETHAPYFAEPFNKGILDIEALSGYYHLSSMSKEERSDPVTFKRYQAQVAETVKQRYRDGVQRADRAVADLLLKLEELGMSKTTILVIAADHGEEFLERDRIGHKSSLYNELVHVPLIIHIPPEFEVDLPDQPAGVSLVDVAPTILDLAGVEDGLSNKAGWSLLKPYPDSRRPRYMMVQFGQLLSSAVILDPYKLILQENLSTGVVDTLLFNLSSDPSEQVNLYPAERAVSELLGTLLQDEIDRTPAVTDFSFRNLSPQKIQRLKSLGYVN
jgi:arylsulfatase A-like enzyme